MTPTPGTAAAPGCADVTLAPRYWLPLLVLILGLAALPLQRLWGPALWLSLVVSLFGLFLCLQSALLRLTFTADALLVARQDTLLRRFPYSDWLEWTLFWPGLPVLFYFREQKSIHLLPMLFDARALQQQLQARMPQLQPSNT
ncbi:MAG: DUF3119 family protein [Cyanobacteriota bacterium]|nr:DUF3119 family protein [Cyanobacteriota bacterium]